MVEVLKPGQLGNVKLERLTISKSEEEFSRIRAVVTQGRETPVRAGEYMQLTVGSTLMMSDTQMEQQTNKNPISMLMEISQAEGSAPPEYAVVQSGPSHSPTFQCVARFRHFCVEVTSRSKQEAKTQAARELVAKLG